jgi:hypothetical protein
MTSGFISTSPQLRQKRLLSPATTTPKNDVRADARRRPPTIARPSLYACSLCMQHAFLPFLEEVPIQLGPRFVKTTHSYDSFHGTLRTHESFSCKLVVTYRVLQMKRSHRGGSPDPKTPRCAWREAQSLFQSVAMYRVITITTVATGVRVYGSEHNSRARKRTITRLWRRRANSLFGRFN